MGYPRWRRRAILATGLAAVLMVLLATAVPAAAIREDSARTARPAVPVLQWKPCAPASDAALAGFECATAGVPLDYRHPMGSKISLAVVKHTATGPGRRLGTLFINPGGPGGAGTVQIPGWLDFVPKTLRELFDVVSWDPRGVGQSTSVQCFPTAAAEQAFLGELADFPLGAAQQRAYINRWADLGLRCAQRSGHLLEHVTTAETARDLDLLRRAVGDPKLTYLGLSYGTFLGATYANLFPERVRALVLDGNVAPDAWTNKGSEQASQSISLRIGSDIGAAKTLDALLDLCGRTTAANCAFSAGTGARTRAKFDALLVRLRSGPIILGTGPSAIAITYAGLLGKLTDGLDIVQPSQNKQVPDASIGGWPAIAGALQRLWEARDRPVGSTPVSSVASAPLTQPAAYAGPEQGLSVVCGESPSPRASQFPRLAELEPQRAGPIGQVALWGDEPCSTWPAHSPVGYRGPWNRPTAAPILVIGNTADPATPLANAEAMVDALAHARLLAVDGYGHTAFLNPSTCANSAVVAYILRGTLPHAGTVCQQDREPFSGSP